MLKKMVKEELILTAIKIPPSALREMRAKARKYTKGNLSAWLRYAGVKCEPTKDDVV